MSAIHPKRVLDAKAPLRERYGEPLGIAVAFEKDTLDDHHRAFIGHSPFVCVATTDAGGQPVVSPKGDEPGFVRVLDERTLLVPDRPGNNKLLGFDSLVDNPKLALLFIIPGHDETLRIEGRARIVTDDDLLARGAVVDRLPPAALLVEVTKAYVHCGKSMIRSHLWDPERRVARGTLPSLGRIIIDQANLPIEVDEAESKVEYEYRDNLY